METHGGRKVRRPVGLQKKDWSHRTGSSWDKGQRGDAERAAVMQSSGGWSKHLSFPSEKCGLPLKDFP